MSETDVDYKDIYRFKVLSDVREKRLRQVDAAVILNVSVRHILKILKLKYLRSFTSIILISHQRTLGPRL